MYHHHHFLFIGTQEIKEFVKFHSDIMGKLNIKERIKKVKSKILNERNSYRARLRTEMLKRFRDPKKFNK